MHASAPEMRMNLDTLKPRFRIAFSDPCAAFRYIFEGRKGGVRYKLSQLLQVKAGLLKSIFLETNEFDDYIKGQLLSVGYGLNPMSFVKSLYVICRVAKPVTVVETGVATGVSTTYILKALERNNKGELYSIDMPHYEEILAKKIHGYLPKSIRSLPKEKVVGWLVPDKLKHRWHLDVGLTKDLLPRLCESLGDISIFLHDSEHTYENMYFEYTTVWPHLAKNGYLLSDDTWWNNSFSDFCREVEARPTYVYSTGIAGVRKTR